MKFTFAAEDTIIGIICGLLLIGLTGRFFSLKLSNIVYVLAFIAYIIFLLLDIVNEAKDLTTHFGFIVFSLAHSIVDLGIAAAFVSYFSGWNIPYVTANFVPYLKNEALIFYAGMFLVIGNVIWLILYPFLD
ncbi:hypothetical protein HYX08_01125 [Candidatus Woesearchaeota archaeon]|nr:hypothetical protein [Candidatus Woesearchaeota archaeon]